MKLDFGKKLISWSQKFALKRLSAWSTPDMNWSVPRTPQLLDRGLAVVVAAQMMRA